MNMFPVLDVCEPVSADPLRAGRVPVSTDALIDDESKSAKVLALVIMSYL